MGIEGVPGIEVLLSAALDGRDDLKHQRKVALKVLLAQAPVNLE